MTKISCSIGNIQNSGNMELQCGYNGCHLMDNANLLGASEQYSIL
jgi:hypothetical protein